MNRTVDSTEQLVTEVVVTDIRRSTEFYRLLGFQLLRDDGEFVELAWEGHHFFLAAASMFHENHERAERSPLAFPPANVRVVVPDVDAHWQRANALGIRVVAPINDRNYGLRDFTIADPDGFGIRFASVLVTVDVHVGQADVRDIT